ncbi:MAG: DNA primase [Anaeroplasma sp.]
MVTDQEIERIIEATDMVRLVSNYVDLKKDGKNYKGLCPFHSEKTPSFVVSPEKKIAHCFGCGTGGNPINFLMKVENIEFKDALVKLANFNGIELKNIYEQKPNHFLKYYKIMQTSVDFYKKNLQNTKEGIKALEYLHKRGLDDEIINMFNIGLSPKIGDTLYKVLKEYEYLELDMSDVGLVDKGKNGYYDLFCERIMFPIYTEDGNPVGFSGRVYSNDPKQAKYVNTRETIIFKKGELLFNLNQAKGEILKKKRIILHEGQMDVIASYRSGLKEAVCSMGTALTITQAKILSKYSKNVVICYDGDSAGIKASKKAINIFKMLGFTIHLVLFPDGMDPDEYVNKFGNEAYYDYFNNNIIDSTQFLVEASLKSLVLNDSNVVEAIKNEIFSILIGLSNTEIDLYLNKLASAINANYESLYQDFNYYYNTHQNNNIVEIYPGNEEIINIEPEVKKINENKWNSKCEIRLFKYALASKEKALYIDNQLSDRMDAMAIYTQNLWISLVNNFYIENNIFDEKKFLNMLSKEDSDYYLSIMEELSKDKNPYTDTDMNECLIKLKELKYTYETKNLKNKLSTCDDLEKSKIINEMFELKRKKNKLNKIRRG